MRLVVASDSHGAAWRLLDAVQQQLEGEGEQSGAAVSPQCLMFLGDGEDDLHILRKYCPQLKIYAVRGNCDSQHSDLPEVDVMVLAGVKIMYMHGHQYAVKSTNDSLLAAARVHGAQLTLFGHTHTPYYSYEDGLYIFNPGSIEAHSYGVVDITDAGVFCFHCKV
jgi:putative phosphoesterase